MKEPKKISPVIFLIRVLIYALALPFILWNICFGFIAGYILLVASCGFVPLLRKKTLRHTLLLICTLAFLYLVTIPLTLWQYQVKTKEFYRKIEKGQQLILNEKISIYGLNLILGLVALPVYPEVAKETLYLCIPSKNDVRTFNGDFFLKSRKIRKAIESNESRVSWSAVEFTFGHRESRFALALN
ncbi:MAG TPA: hypothetical protein PLB27_14705, partial [Bacteroidales bacterium]|nr:hypothetical protein [Bacteroidales bacterium]